MYRILEKKVLAPDIYFMKLSAPRIARSAKPGQFLIVKADEEGERIPLTICDYNSKEGTVAIVFQAVGSSTNEMASYEEGESFSDVVGPLGNPSEFVGEDIDELKSQKFMFVAGGVGTAPIYPQVKWLHEHGINADVIIGTRTKKLLLFENEMRSVARNLYIATDDGSYGFNGLVTGLLEDLIKKGHHYDKVITIGPMIMMKFVSKLTKKYGIKTIASLNSIMVDGTGMCGACRVTVGNVTKFTCIDGPEFDAHLIDFDEAMRRQTMYKTEEGKKKIEDEERREGHKCRIGLDGDR
ncbi:MAG: sulfide/dihydroorotate dehydrogenase-like FAD/NAD-binding protein [Clostridiales bacterium]|nr:sulfide/dihydroorotate dehydrogenase-like FAD/NAD-binding protein [Clostridiales bacterium]